MGIPSWNAGDQYEGIFQKFRLGLQSWCRTGKEPEAGNQDVKYYLQLQENRLKEHGLKREELIEPDQPVMSIHKISSSLPVFGSEASRFDQSLYAQSVNRTVTFSREGKTLLKQKKYVTMYETILDPAPGEKHLGQTTYVCPNCGAISKLHVLQDTGCPYCQTRYLMKDLYPKVTNYYYISSGDRSEGTWKRRKKWLVIAAAALSLIQGGYTLLTDPEFTLVEAALGCVLGFAVWAFFIYIFFSLGLLVWTFIQAGKSLPLVAATAGTKGRLARRLKEFDPAFDYAYFEGKALALARILMLSPQPEACAQYDGPPLSDRFSDVVDIQYRGGIGVGNIRKNGDRIEVVLNLFLTNTLDRNGKLKQKDEKIRIHMYHKAAFPVKQAFSILKVQCSGCGGSFDAGKVKNCPFCGKTYDAGVDDWVVTNISRA